MAVTPGYTFTSASDPITFAKLNLLGTPALTIGTSEVTTTMIANNAVTLAKMATVATGTLLGRKTAATGNVEAIVINNTNITQPPTGFVIGNSATDSSLLIGQSSTAYAQIYWSYAATEANAFLTFAAAAPTQNSLVMQWKTYSFQNNNSTILQFDANQNNILGVNSALATNATNGFTYIRTCAGTPTGVPAASYTGMVPMIFDTSGVKIWYYTGGAWKGVVVA